MENWINICLYVTCIGLIAGVLWWAVGSLPFIPAPIGQIIRVVIVVVASIAVIRILFGHLGTVHLSKMIDTSQSTV